MKKNSRKNFRLNEEVKREMTYIVREEIKDPRINPMTSVAAVEVAPDLKTCKVYISVLGNEEEQQETMEGLKSAAGYARKCLAQSLNLCNTPEIRFILDQSIEHGVEMIQKIDEVNAQDAAKNAARAEREESENAAGAERKESKGEE